MNTTASNPYATTDTELARPADGYNDCAIWGIKNNRIGRFRLLTRWLLTTLAFYGVLGLVFVGAMTGSSAITGIISILTFVASIAFVVYFFMTIAQRFHDMGKSGWFTLLTLIPFVVIWPLVAKGDEGANAYGNPPPPNTTLNKVCGWIYISLTVLSILVMIALPGVFMAAFSDAMVVQ